MLHAGLDLSRKKLDVCLLSDRGEHLDQLAVAPERGRGQRRQVGLALAHRLGPALPPHGVQLVGQRRRIGDRPRRERGQ